MHHEQRLEILRRLERGELPRQKCLVTWFGRGSGQPCAACGLTIARSEIECECEHPDGAVIRFHQTCFVVWEQERGA